MAPIARLIPLCGASLRRDLRSSRSHGQSHFVICGLFLPNLGVDFDLTPRLKIINNVNLLWFDQTNVLEQFLFDGQIDRFIGTDLGVGFD